MPKTKIKDVEDEENKKIDDSLVEVHLDGITQRVLPGEALRLIGLGYTEGPAPAWSPEYVEPSQEEQEAMSPAQLRFMKNDKAAAEVDVKRAAAEKKETKSAAHEPAAKK